MSAISNDMYLTSLITDNPRTDIKLTVDKIVVILYRQSPTDEL